MSENKMAEVAKMFGLKLGDKFKLQLDSEKFINARKRGEIIDAVFEITENGVILVTDGWCIFHKWAFIHGMLTGQLKVVKIEQEEQENG